MIVIVITRESLSPDNYEELRSAGIDTSDIDFIIVASKESIIENPEYNPEDYLSCFQWDQSDYFVDRLLRGSGEWFKTTFNGAECAVGIAYH